MYDLEHVKKQLRLEQFVHESQNYQLAQQAQSNRTTLRTLYRNLLTNLWQRYILNLRPFSRQTEIPDIPVSTSTMG